MANTGKYLGLTGGIPKEEAAIDTTSGVGDASKIIKTGSDGKLDSTLLPTGIGAETKAITASEALSAGDLVNIHVSSGTKVRKADATATGKEAHGFVLAAVLSAGTATVYLEGTVTGLSGMTPGAQQFLDTTAGARTETCPSGSGKVAQMVGVAVSATEMSFEPQPAIVQA